jgi:hypothetical protein
MSGTRKGNAHITPRVEIGGNRILGEMEMSVLEQDVGKDQLKQIY